jgi:hypothetical protein
MQATGIQIDNLFLRRATVRRKGQNFVVSDLKTQPIDGSCKPDLHTPTVLVSGLHSNDLLIRSRTFTPARSRKLRQALILQVEALLHLKAEELITVSQLESHEKRATTYSTTQSALTTHLETFRRLNLDPERVSAVPAALKTFVKWKESELSSYFLLDVGLTTTNCIWVENNLLQKAHAIPFGFPLLKNNYQEVLKLLHSFHCQRPMILTGEVNDDSFRKFLLQTVQGNISEDKRIGNNAEELRFAICIGLALDYLVNNKQPLQFRVGSFISRQSWRKLGRSSAALLTLSALLSSLIFGTGTWWIEKRKSEIAHNLETWTTEKDPSLRSELFSAGKETPDLVNQWIRLIEKNSKDYRYLMKAPKVAQVITWLTQHPVVESFRLSSDPVFFEKIHYQLVSLPRLEALDDPYLVKVELSFKVNSPLHARKFHEMLLEGSDFVDSSREIGWESLPDHYQVSFYLKNL